MALCRVPREGERESGGSSLGARSFQARIKWPVATVGSSGVWTCSHLEAGRLDKDSCLGCLPHGPASLSLAHLLK